jgi:hypothetical protein
MRVSQSSSTRVNKPNDFSALKKGNGNDRESAAGKEGLKVEETLPWHVARNKKSHEG